MRVPRTSRPCEAQNSSTPARSPACAAQVVRVAELEQAAAVVPEEPALDETVDLVEIDAGTSTPGR